jgi:PAS domain S-box-containing protein
MSSAKETTILVIEDEKPVRQSFRAHLEDSGFRVLEAENGEEGVRLHEKEAPSLVLVDLRMPVMDGYEVIHAIRATSPNTPVIVVSGANSISDAVEAIRMGAWDYVMKPVTDLDALLHSIRRNLERAELLKAREAYQEHLETEVKKRTGELHEANQLLIKTNERLRQVAQSASALSAITQKEDFAPRLLAEFGTQMDTAGGSLYIIEGGALRLAASLDPGHAPESIPLPLAPDSVFHYALAQGQALLLPDVRETPGILPSGWTGYKEKSALVFPLFDSGGEAVGLVALHDKITGGFTGQDREMGALLAAHASEALKAARATAALRQSEERYRDLVENISDVIYTLNTKGEFQYVSPAVIPLLGYTPEEVKGRSYQEFVHEEALEMLFGRLVDIVTGGPVQPFEYRVRDKAGRLRWVRSTTKVKKTEDGQTELRGLLTDITELKERDEEQKNLETQLRKAQKMEALGTLAGGIAHDFNNILTPILVFTQMAMDSVKKNGTVHKQLGKVMAAARRAKDLVGLILTMSRRTETEKRPVQAQIILREAYKLLRSTIPASIQIIETIERDTPPVLADPTQLHQVLMNLCTNAYHAMPEGGVLTIEYSPAESVENTAGLAPGRYARLRVRDTGHGMDEATLEKIFDPYFTTKPPEQGTGLGLAVVHGIVASMGGAVTVTSSPGQGSEFVVYMPLHLGGGACPEPGGKRGLSKGTGRVLFVDDEEAIATMGTPMLEYLGYQAVVASDPLLALELFHADPAGFDLVLTDITMPAMPGDLLAKKILEIRPDIPVILCTGFSQAMSADKARELGAAEFLQKPLVLEKVAEVIRRVLDESAKKREKGRTGGDLSGSE